MKVKPKNGNGSLTPMQRFGRMIRKARDRVGMSQVVLAKKLGVSSFTMSLLETGKVGSIHAKNLAKICEVFHDFRRGGSAP